LLKPLTFATGALPFQFPARWSLSGTDRHIDILARGEGDGEKVPWVLELKTKGRPHNGRPSQYYRHAVTQVVLYREYLRGAKQLHFWFEEQGLDMAKIRAAVAFPRQENWRANDLAGVLALAKDFDVEIIELKC